jgi:NodT family efflux transporter outer membrane factor (OMF) lipoprotein
MASQSRSALFSSLAQRAALAALILTAACTTVGRDYEAPKLDVPAAWSSTTTSDAKPALFTVEGESDARWWERLETPALADLVQRALASNRDLRAAVARLERARALRGAAEGERLPSLDARGSYEHRRESENTPFGAFIPRTDIHSIGVDASWEPDFWGRVRRSVETAGRELEASEADVRTVAMALAAEVARTYVELASAQRRLEIALSNVELQERTLRLVESRVDAGLVGPRDVAQASANVESTRSRVPALQTSARAASHRLAVLLGLAPGQLDGELGALRAVPRAQAALVVGVPADLLRRRPDVVAAERRYAAEVARVGVAEGDLYPRFTLSGTLGLSSDGSEHLFDGDSRVLGIGPSLRWNLFDGGRLRERVRAQEASALAAQNEWEQTVLLALEEAENAMTSFVREQDRRGSLERAAEHARRAVDLAQTQYREGLTDFQAVLDSLRIVAGLEDELAVSDAAITTHLIALYKALGGGFEAGSLPMAVAAAENAGGGATEQP